MKIRLVILATTGFFVCANVSWAQTLQPRPVEKKSVQEELSPAQQDELANQVYELTKSAKRARDYARIIERCESALQQKLNDKNQSYFNSLLAWALYKRADKRIETYHDMISIGNAEQANLVIESALADADRSIKLDESKWKPFLTRGAIHSQMKQYAKAAADFQKVSQLAESKSYGWFNLAEVNFQLKKFEEALTNYQKAVEISKGDVQAITGIAHCHVKLKQPAKAVEKYTVVIRMRPDSIVALINRGDAQLGNHQWQAAYDDYSKAAKLAGTRKDAIASMTYQRAAWMLACCPDEEFFQPDTALQLAKTAIKVGKESALNLETLAAAQAATGSFSDAVKTQLKAMAMIDAPTQPMKSRLESYKKETPFLITK